jgi:hypothetical protein
MLSTRAIGGRIMLPSPMLPNPRLQRPAAGGAVPVAGRGMVAFSGAAAEPPSR